MIPALPSPAARRHAIGARQTRGERLAAPGEIHGQIVDRLVHGVVVIGIAGMRAQILPERRGIYGFQLDSMSTLPKRYCGPSSSV